ncbi:MAG TPA: hypothetical protein VI935_09375 [Thermodesulfobacteriota bacterium]|nr:hypothetical protein [Thermodesulfobacteriota bacterium]
MVKVLKVSLFLLTILIIPTSIKAETPSPEPGKRLITHIVKKGEELHLLAGYYLLNARDWYLIYNRNSDVIRNQNRIFPGQELMIYVDNDWQPPYNLDEYIKGLGRE